MSMMESCQSYLRELSRLGVLVGDFYLLLGRAFPAAPLPADVARGPARACYLNAGQLAMERPELAYCEGFAMRPGLIPMHHAWCVDSEGRVVDPTWPDDDGNEYWGLALQPEFHLLELERTGYWGVLAERIPVELARRDPVTYLHPAWLPPQEHRMRFQEKVAATLSFVSAA